MADKAAIVAGEESESDSDEEQVTMVAPLGIPASVAGTARYKLTLLLGH